MKRERGDDTVATTHDSVEDDGPVGVSDEEFAKNKPLVLEALTSEERAKHAWDRDFYRTLHPRYRSDPDIALAALTNICGQMVFWPRSPYFAEWEDIPEELKDDLGFCARAISAGVGQFPMEDKDITAQEFLKNLTKIPDEDWCESLLEASPDLANERLFCLAVARSPRLDVDSFFERVAPPAMRTDKEVMAAACSKDFDVLWELVDGALLNDPDFLKDVLNLEPKKLRRIEPATLSRFPDLLIEFLPIALSRVHDDYPGYEEEEEDDYVTEASVWIPLMANQIPQEMWNNNRHVVRAWFKGGGTFIEAKHEGYKNEPLVAGWICEHFLPENDGPGLVQNFRRAVPALLQDKDFMFKAVALNPDVFYAATDNLQRDFSFQLIAFGETPGHYPYVNARTWPHLRRRMIQFRARAAEELQSHRDFEFLAQQNPSVLPSDLIADAEVLPGDERVKTLQAAMENIAAASLRGSSL